MIGGGSLARRYARALLAIGQEEGQTRRILEEAERFERQVGDIPLLREMMEAAQNLEFERAAELRDRIQELKDRQIMVGAPVRMVKRKKGGKGKR